MTENTKIEWADHTFNPWVGCTKVSPACDFCYAEKWAKRTGHPELWQGERRRTSDANWRKPLTWNANAPAFFAQHGRRQRVFCASLADVFDNQVPWEWRYGLWELIDRTPDLDWLILTKRPQNIAQMMPVIWSARMPRNIWLGCTVENQEEADRRIPLLLKAPAAVRFLSMEPLLGPVNLSYALHAGDGIDGVIVGGETGGQYRRTHPEWIRELRDQCVPSGVAFFFKQWGDWKPVYDRDLEDPDWRQCSAIEQATPRGEWLNYAGGMGFHGDRVVRMDRLGKEKAGRLLDGREWNEMPRSAA